MEYNAEKPTTVTFNTLEELQAMSWAAQEIHSIEPFDLDAQSAYMSTLCAIAAQHDGIKDFTLSGEEAASALSTLQRWVEAGPPQEKGEVTDAARTKSYQTACAIVAKTVELP